MPLICCMAAPKLIFDFGNVLIRVNESLTYQAFEALGARPELADHRSLFYAFDKGEINTKAFTSGIKEYLPQRVSHAEVLRAWNAMLLEIPNSSFQLMRKLRKHFDCYLLSNTSFPHIAEIKRQAGLYQWAQFANNFQALHYSYDLGCRKPDHAIFQMVMDKEGWKDESCILIDDREENLKAAETFGWKAMHFALDKGHQHAILQKQLLSLL